MKQCTNCQRVLPTDRFASKSWINKDGSKTRTLKSHCRECINKANLVRYHSSPSTKKSHKEASYRYNIKKYGLTIGQYEQMLKDQNYCCKICNQTTGRRLNIDHSHKTGRVRSLLCHNCNTALGHTNESIDRLNLLIKYLEENNE